MNSRAFGCGLAIALMGCQALPEIPAGDCGNRAVEPGEDCDHFALRGSECRPPGSIGACHFDCSPDETGTPRACPAGFGCDEGAVCRRATNGFDALPNPVPGGYQTLETGDFDGDGRADVVAGDARGGSRAQTHFDVRYYDERGQPTGSFGISEPVSGAALFTQQSDGGRQGLVVAGSALGVLLGERDRTLSPHVRPSYFLFESRLIVVPVSVRDVERTTPLIVLTDRGEQVALHIPATEGVLLNKLLDLPYAFDEMTPPVKGKLFDGDDHPCDELVLSAFGAREVAAYQVCLRDPDSGQLLYRSRALVTTLELPDGAVVDGGPLIVDLDGDSHADVLVATDRGLYFAAGDGESLEPFAPFELALLDIRDDSVTVVDQESLQIRPLAAADFTGDGRADLVDPRVLLVTQGTNANVFRPVHANSGALWSEAMIGDLTGDGRPDVVASSKDDTDFQVFTGTGTDRPNALSIATTHPAERLTIGDYDGDQIGDVAFIERGAGPALEDEFLVAFGGTFETLSTPVPGGHVGDMWDLISPPHSSDDSRSDLAILHALTAPDGTRGSAMSLVQGSTGRKFVSPVQLEDVDETGAIQEADALMATTGRFRSATSVDAMALAYHHDSDRDAARTHPELWLLPDLGSRASTTRAVGWGIDPRLVPAVVDETDPEFGAVFASFTSGDLDGDGLDEVVVAAPIERRTRCMIAPAGLAGSATTAAVREPIVLDEPCVAGPAVRVVDLDADGAQDLVLATGGIDGPGRIVALWNDGGGSFDAEQATTVAPNEDGARAFAAYPSSAGGMARIAYVSEHAVRVVESRGRGQPFADLGRVAELEMGTGIAAGDITGDGLVDLAVADAGWIRVLAASVVRR